MNTLTGCIKKCVFLCLFLSLVTATVTADDNSTTKGGYMDLLGLLVGITNEPIRVRTLEEQERDPNRTVLDFIGMVEKYPGYTAEEHRVITEDGYILTLHRISGSPLSPKRNGKPVVFLQHGLGASSDLWVMLGREHSLGLQLADAGYDVWLGNIRGNSYCKLHKRYSSKYDISDFWKFGLDEIGIYDMKAFMVYILEHTNNKPITFVGYSIGSSLIYIFLSTHPEYNNKVNLIVSIAPATYFAPSEFNFAKTFLTVVREVAKLSFKAEILPMSIEASNFGKEFCDGTVISNACKKIFEPVTSFHKMNQSILPTLFTYLPAGTSFRTVEHVLQIINSGKIQKYDYGCLFSFWCNNQNFYNQTEPPAYNLTNITAPNVILYSDGDVVIKPGDVQILKNNLKNVISMINIPNFNHMDFVWSLFDKVVYDKIIEILNNLIKTVET